MSRNSCFRRHSRLWTGLAVAGLVGVGVTLRPADNKAPEKKEGSEKTGMSQEVALRGRVVCLPEAMHELHGTDLPTNHTHLYGFKTEAGGFYTLLRTRWSEGLFVDERMRAKELILIGRVLPKTQIFDLSALRSVKNSQVFDLYYYCDICAIKTLSPGPCMCCQEPVELIEQPR